ncbi:MAG: hypothetical protein RL220_651 [Bacteroidota bacterium]|jgi:hypothetical protein
MRLISLFTVLLLCNLSFAQKTDSLPDVNRSKWSEKWHMEHSPMKATVLSAVLPGAGQIYNGKWWKAPVVWTGMGVAAGFIIYNGDKYRTYRDALIAASDGNDATVNDTPYNAAQLDELQDTYHRWLDISWFSLIGVYMLNVIDANVDAHLWYFDVGDDLSLELRPSWVKTVDVRPGFSICLRF